MIRPHDSYRHHPSGPRRSPLRGATWVALGLVGLVLAGTLNRGSEAVADAYGGGEAASLDDRARPDAAPPTLTVPGRVAYHLRVLGAGSSLLCDDSGSLDVEIRLWGESLAMRSSKRLAAGAPYPCLGPTILVDHVYELRFLPDRGEGALAHVVTPRGFSVPGDRPAEVRVADPGSDLTPIEGTRRLAIDGRETSVFGPGRFLPPGVEGGPAWVLEAPRLPLLAERLPAFTATIVPVGRPVGSDR